MAAAEKGPGLALSALNELPTPRSTSLRPGAAEFQPPASAFAQTHHAPSSSDERHRARPSRASRHRSPRTVHGRQPPPGLYDQQRPSQRTARERRRSDRRAHGSHTNDVGQSRTVNRVVTTQKSSAELGPLCVICCEMLQGPEGVVIGPCNHREVCARCCLRMRLSYDDTKCPLCKASQQEVIVIHWRPDLPSWQNLHEHRRRLWTNPRWARGVLVDNTPLQTGHHRSHESPLSSVLQGITSLACCICDHQGRHPYPTDKALLQHMDSAHGRRICEVCLTAHVRFPTELEAFNADELLAHIASHPECTFCQRKFLHADALFEHNRLEHFTCGLCQAQGNYLHFQTQSDMLDHLRLKHHLCEAEGCRQSFVAFNTEAQLMAHISDFHSPHAPQRRIRHQHHSRRHEPHVSHAVQLPANGHHRREDHQAPSRHPEGITIIDDDLGTTGNAFFPPLSASQDARAQQHPHDTDRGIREEYPSLQAAEGTQSPQPTLRPSRVRQAPAPLVTVTVKCACGRKVSHIPVREGQEVEAPRCDTACMRLQRQNRLADAFGVDDPSQHVPWVDRQRTPKYSSELLVFAWHNRPVIQELERKLAGFVISSQDRRFALPIQPRALRAIVHQLATQYGLASQSYGSEPRRHIELFKSAAVSVPSPLLSQTAGNLTLDDVTAISRAEQGFPLRLVDCSPNADLWSLFSRWDGQFSIEGPGPDGSAVVRFANAGALAEASAAFGGGLRGLFRIAAQPTGIMREVAPVPSSDSGPARGTQAAARGPAAIGAANGAIRPEPPVASNQFARLALDDVWENG